MDQESVQNEFQYSYYIIVAEITKSFVNYPNFKVIILPVGYITIWDTGLLKFCSGADLWSVPELLNLQKN